MKSVWEGAPWVWQVQVGEAVRADNVTQGFVRSPRNAKTSYVQFVPARVKDHFVQTL